MADLIDLDDVAHWWGSDLQLGATGDLARVSLTPRSNQRVLRRLMTNPGDYLAHLDYGAGVPAEVGDILDLPRIIGKVRGQMLIEDSVLKAPEPTVTAVQTGTGVSVTTTYTAAPERQPAALSFDVDR